MPGDPHNTDVFEVATGLKIIRMIADVGGKFENIVLIRPDEYEGGIFVDDGNGGVDVENKNSDAVLLNIPNAAIGAIDEHDLGAWITQTAL